MSDEFYESPIKSLRREKEEAQREGLRLIGLLRERDDTLAAVREWAEVNVEHRVFGAHYIKAAEDVLAILNRSDTDE